MKRILLILTLCIGFLHQNLAQVTFYPKVEKQELAYMSITKVEITSQYTIVDMSYRCPYKGSSWACANKEFYIVGTSQATLARKTLLFAKNIPICDKKHWFTRKDTVLTFQLFFPKIEAGITKVNIIEGVGHNQFNFDGVTINNPLLIQKTEIGKTTKKTTNNSTIKTNTKTTTTKKTTTSNTTNNTTPPTVVAVKPTVQFGTKQLQVKDSINVKILFDHASDVIDETSLPELAKLLDFMQKNPTVEIALEGHTEADDREYTQKQRQSNLKLSIDRINSVKSFLVTKGIPTSRIQTKAYGGARPISADPAVNRRVVMKILKF